MNEYQGLQNTPDYDGIGPYEQLEAECEIFMIKESYELEFHCGAKMIIHEVPNPAQMKEGFRDIPIEGTPFRLRFFPCAVGMDSGPKFSDGSKPDCYICKGNRRKSRRKQYYYFPNDYKQEREGKYKDKRFFQFARLRISCFPKAAHKALKGR